MTSININADLEKNSNEEKAGKEQEWILARKGIGLLINNNYEESQALFLKYPDSLIMYAGYSFTVFMDALMSFDEEKLSNAILVLKEVEKRSTAKNGWLKSFSLRMFGPSAVNLEYPSPEEQLETQIILADSQVCLAIITFLQQDLSGYFKGAWVLRKAWKIYQKTYKDILALYKQTIGEMQLPDPLITSNSASIANPEENLFQPEWDLQENQLNGYLPTSTSNLSHSRSLNFNSNHVLNLEDPSGASNLAGTVNNNAKKESRPLRKSFSINDSLSSRRKIGLLGSARFSFTSSSTLADISSSFRDIFPTSVQNSSERPVIDKATVVRLMGAVSFGYGLFHLGVSLLPPSLTRLISILGFGTNKQNGIACLMYARLGVDMRAPLASLALLWYHTIVRPFYAVDGTNVQAGVEVANILIQESKKEFAQSSLFLFFDGRASRLKSDIPSALTSFRMAKNNANHHEIKVLCLHEIGWCYLIELEYRNASDTFCNLKQASRWSRSFYVYLSAICIGAIPDVSRFNVFDEIREVPMGSRGSQLDEFLERRLRCCPKDSEAGKAVGPVYFRLLVFEMLYLWNALASCNPLNVQRIVTDCLTVRSADDEPRLGLSSLILGACYNVQHDFDQAESCFRKCLEQRRHQSCNAEDAHISAFAQYELGNILIHSQQSKEEGKCQLQQISRYTHYDFEARLNVRVHSILKQLD